MSMHTTNELAGASAELRRSIDSNTEIAKVLLALRTDISGHARKVQAMLEHDSRPGRIPNRGNRKSTRLNSSHVKISYAVFCLKKKKKKKEKRLIDTYIST